MITTEDIQKLAELSRINIAPEEQESLRTQIESILGYIDQIKKVGGSAEGVSKLDPGALHNILREDGAAHTSGEFTERILSAAPTRQGNYLKVKKIL